MLEIRTPETRVDAVLLDAAEAVPSDGSALGLVISPGRMQTDPTLPEAGSLEVIVYPRAPMVRSKRAAQEPVRRLKICLEEGEDWPLREILEQLRASHGVRRVAVAVRPRLFRALAAAGLVDELSIAWRPVIAGDSLPPITGRDREFLPRGIVLDLLKIERKEMEYVARYRVRRAR
jgi:riboflavin biosynthesis pyrimidine reductase